MNRFKKVFAAALLLSAIAFMPGYTFAEAGEMALLFNYSKMEYKGKYSDHWPSSYNTVDNSEQVLRLDFEYYLLDKIALGADLSFFGSNKYSCPEAPTSNGKLKSEKESVFGSGVYARANILDIQFSSESDSKFRIYGKGGLGYYMRDITVNAYNGSQGKWREDNALKPYTGFFYAIGTELALGNFVLGAEYRYDKTFAEFKKEGTNGYWIVSSPAFESSQIGVNAGLRFGGRSSSGSSRDTAASQNSFDSPAITSNAGQVNNNLLGDKPASGFSAGVPNADARQESPAAGVKKRSAASMSELDAASADKPKAFNRNPEAIELDKDEYLANMDKIWDEGAKNGKIGIPSMGVLFQIGKSQILPYYHEMLNDFVDLYKETDGTAKILIEGFSSNGGNESVKNPKLSQQRAKAVAEYLIKEGISKDNLIVKAYGNSKISTGMFAGTKGCKGGQCYRRVNIGIK